MPNQPFQNWSLSLFSIYLLPLLLTIHLPSWFRRDVHFLFLFLPLQTRWIAKHTNIKVKQNTKMQLPTLPLLILVSSAVPQAAGRPRGGREPEVLRPPPPPPPGYRNVTITNTNTEPQTVTVILKRVPTAAASTVNPFTNDSTSGEVTTGDLHLHLPLQRIGTTTTTFLAPNDKKTQGNEAPVRRRDLNAANSRRRVVPQRHGGPRSRPEPVVRPRPSPPGGAKGKGKALQTASSSFSSSPFPPSWQGSMGDKDRFLIVGTTTINCSQGRRNVTAAEQLPSPLPVSLLRLDNNNNNTTRPPFGILPSVPAAAAAKGRGNWTISSTIPGSASRISPRGAEAATGGSFTITQVLNPRYANADDEEEGNGDNTAARNGLVAMVQAYAKYGVDLTAEMKLAVRINPLLHEMRKRE